MTHHASSAVPFVGGPPVDESLAPSRTAGITGPAQGCPPPVSIRRAALRPSRRSVAATTAAPRTGHPAAFNARTASTNVAPVVVMSSTTMHGVPGPGVPFDRAIRLPRRFASRPATSSPAWSATRLAWDSSRSARADTPAVRRTPPARLASNQVTSAPLSLTVGGVEGTGTSRIAPMNSRSSRPATDHASAEPSGAASPQQRRSLKATRALRHWPVYLAAARTCNSALRTMPTSARASSAARQLAQSPQPGAPQPGQADPSRSSPAESR